MPLCTNVPISPFPCSGSLRGHFRDYRLFLDEQADQGFAMDDPVLSIREIGGTTIRSVGNISKLQRGLDSDADFLTSLDMLAELRDDNLKRASRLRQLHELCDEARSTSRRQAWSRCGSTKRNAACDSWLRQLAYGICHRHRQRAGQSHHRDGLAMRFIGK